MSTQTRGLGRGLGALIPPPTQGEAHTGLSANILELNVTDIIPNPRQPRTRLDDESLSELAASIKEHGMLQPLIVTRARPTDRAPYQLIAGERRWRAARLAGLTVVPAVLKEATPQQFLELALVENIQRADLNPLEEAEAYHALMEDFKLSQQEVADRVGKSRAAVANTVRLLRLPDRVKALLAEGTLSEGHARALLALPDDASILAAADQVVARDLTVRQTEELVRRLLAAATTATSETEPPDEEDDTDRLYTQRLEEAFRSALGTKVALTRGRRGGKLVISFYSDEELQAIYERIVGPQ
ncbi:MAG: ParB/RepB/Spo0J family partition protein [Anaerolineae bacterium]|nr:ParB/RepB/Spo0J family partition protein [Anaerolineae bacterium]